MAPSPIHTLRLILGDQLHDPALLGKPDRGVRIVMAETRPLCTRWRIHRQKLVLFLAAMRQHAQALRAAGWQVSYHELEEDPSRRLDIVDHLLAESRATGAQTVAYARIADRSCASQIATGLAAAGVTVRILPNPSFLSGGDPAVTANLLGKRVHLADFYRRLRCERKVLLDDDGQPTGGRWSLDAENREPWPRGLAPPPEPRCRPTKDTTAVMALVDRLFPDHPGSTAGFAWPTTRAQALAALRSFIRDRLPTFGPYQDAFCADGDVLYHSALSPSINLGLLTPDEVIAAAERAEDAPLASREGFIRQVLGWREFVLAVDQHHGDVQAKRNAYDARARLSSLWWDPRPSTGIPPLDAALERTWRLGWTHHIDRLMVLANLMNLLGVAPGEAIRWFTEAYVDSADWVMGPNVFGMGLRSDGGIMSTKPYVCASAYLRRMGRFAEGPWCDEMDGLYWTWVERHAASLRGNPRCATMVMGLGRLSAARMARLKAAADGARRRLLA